MVTAPGRSTDPYGGKMAAAAPNLMFQNTSSSKERENLSSGCFYGRKRKLPLPNALERIFSWFGGSDQDGMCQRF